MPYTHDQLVEIAFRWASRRYGVVFRELAVPSRYGEIPDVQGFTREHSILIEVKASRTDFLQDRQKVFRETTSLGMGEFRYYCCPEKRILPVEIPIDWGLLYVGPSGRVRKVKHATQTENNINAERDVMFHALRRLHLRGRLEEIYEKKPIREKYKENCLMKTIKEGGQAIRVVLGMRVKDTVTGIQGIAVARTSYLTGCDHISIQPDMDKDGKSPEWVNIDVRRIEIINSVPVKLFEDDTTGLESRAIRRKKKAPVKGGPQPSARQSNM